MNDEKTIKEYELLKSFYFRRKNIISKEEFQNILLDLEDISKERLLHCEFLKKKNDNIEITPLGMYIVEMFTAECEKCGEKVFFNAFVPRAVCPKCGFKMTAESEFTLGETIVERDYKDIMN